ncbi:tetratricopeptide repeat protein [Pseudoduganella rivuli]
MIRGARAGDAECQLALGKLYLFGGASLPQSQPTALHWLNRAALQGRDEAWRLIGRHVGFEHARQNPGMLPWYERAWDAGVTQAGLVLAQLVLLAPEAVSAPLRAKAMQALETAARAGLPDAVRLLGQQRRQVRPAGSAAVPPLAPPDCGDAGSHRTALTQAWEKLPRPLFLAQALPLARQLVHDAPQDAEAARACGWQPTPDQVLLLARCAQAMAETDDPGDQARQAERQRYCELAAFGGDRAAQLALGLWFARMTCDGVRVSDGIAAANFKRAIRWLTQAGEQGLADAWFALSRIYIKPEFSQRSVAEAQACLERAAGMGHSGAQLECGIHAWRARRGDEQNDVRAAYWLQQAAAQGAKEAEAALLRIAPDTPDAAAWAAGLPEVREWQHSQPLLSARIELAQLFGLTRAEALLLDVCAADQGHCLVVDIRASYGRSKRRLVLVRTAQQRQALDRIARLFEAVDCSVDGPEGNYRQRLYRLKTWQAAEDDGLAVA